MQVQGSSREFQAKKLVVSWNNSDWQFLKWIAGTLVKSQFWFFSSFCSTIFRIAVGLSLADRRKGAYGVSQIGNQDFHLLHLLWALFQHVEVDKVKVERWKSRLSTKSWHRGAYVWILVLPQRPEDLDLRSWKSPLLRPGNGKGKRAGVGVWVRKIMMHEATHLSLLVVFTQLKNEWK